jgi:hypothetical protein
MAGIYLMQLAKAESMLVEYFWVKLMNNDKEIFNFDLLENSLDSIISSINLLQMGEKSEMKY